MIAWMAYCDNAENDCTTFSSETANWFKIGEKGLLEGSIETGEWFQKAFSMWDGSPSLWSEMVPTGLKAGRYLVRHEIISLHSANSKYGLSSSKKRTQGANGACLPRTAVLPRMRAFGS
jgi:hypothetical protein